MSRAVTKYLKKILIRDLEGLRAELEAYPDDDALWSTPPGISNSGGTLALHLVGNLRHFIGTVVGGTNYVRDREGEFGRRDIPRDDLLQSIDAAIEEVGSALNQVADEDLGKPFPAPVGGVTLPMGQILVHFAVHFGFHLGQLDYHRRLVTGVNRPVEVLRVSALDGLEERG